MAYLKNAYFSDYSVNALKSLLTANKAVAVMYNAQNAYYNANTAAYSYPEETMMLSSLDGMIIIPQRISMRPPM